MSAKCSESAVNYIHVTPKRFTLVELLVVIAIISVLAGLLLPALQSALFSARNADCTARLKGLATSMIMYTDDFNGAYPTGVAPWTGTDWTGSPWKRPSVLSRKDIFELRPLYESYLGENLGVLLRCPLSSPTWKDGGLVRNGSGSGGQIWATNYQLYMTNNKKSKTFYTESGHASIKSGFKPTNSRSGNPKGLEWRILASDVARSENVSSTTKSLHISGHYARSGATDGESGILTNGPVGWNLEEGSETSANFVETDTSVKTCSIHTMPSLDGNWNWAGNGKPPALFLPADKGR